MKRFLGFILAMLLFAIPALATDSVDLSSMSAAELIALRNEISGELGIRGAGLYLVCIGEHVVGSELSAGTYLVSHMASYSGSLNLYANRDDVLKRNVMEKVSFSAVPAQIELKKGMVVQITNGLCIMERIDTIRTSSTNSQSQQAVTLVAGFDGYPVSEAGLLAKGYNITQTEYVLQLVDSVNSLVTEPVKAFETTTPSAERSGVTPEFKKVMDEYEAFFDDYLEFIKKYENSNNSMSMLMDYVTMMTTFTDTMEALDEIDENDLSIADSAYYLEVTLRITAKIYGI